MANDLKILITGSLNVGKTISEINTALRGIEQKINKININVQVNQSATNALNSLTTQMRTLSSINTTRPMQNLSSGLNSVASSAQNAHQHTLTLGSALQQAFQKFPIWMIASTAFFQSFNFLKDGISYVNDLNKSLTDISIVTYQSQQQVAALGEQYNKLAQNMGVTTDELSKTAADLYRQGLSADEVTSRMKIITEYAKISSLDTQAASEIMTAAINSMGVSAQKAADTWSYLGDATATGADEIGKAMQKVGGTAGSLKIPFDEVSSWIAVISSRTRESAETVGQGVKSILARVQSLKENGFDETDGTQINQVAKALNTVGIKLVDAQGQFRNFGTVMNELGGKWSDLDSRTKAYLATTVAGTYQQSRFLNLMEGYGDVTKLYAGAMDSAGTANKKFELYMQGTEAKINEFKNAIQGIWMSSFNSQGLQMLIDSLTSLANVFKYVVDHVGLLPPALATAGVAIMAFNGGIKSIMTNGMLMITMLKGIPAGLTSMESALATSILKTNILNTATRTLTVTMGALKNVAVFLAGSILPIAAFMAIGFAIEKISQAVSDYNQKQQEAKQKQDDLVKSYSSNADQIDKLASKYKDLSEQVSSGKIDKSNQDYVDTMNQLGKIMPDLVASEDEHGNKILASADAVKKELDYAKQLKDIQDKQTVANFESDLNNQANKVNDLQKKINQAKNEANTPFFTVNNGDGAFSTIQKDASQQLDDQRQLIASERDLQLALQNSKSYIQDKAKAYMDMDGTSQKLSSSQQKLVNSYIDEAAASKKTVKDGEDFKQFLSDTTNNAADLAKTLAQLPNDLNGAFSTKDLLGLSKEQTSYLRSIGLLVRDGGTDWDAYSTALKSVFKNADTVTKIIDTLKDSTKQDSDATDEATYSVDQLDKALQSAKGDYNAVKDVITQMIQSKQYDMAVTASQQEAYSALSDSISPVNKMLEDLANGQQLSASSAMDLIQKVPELTKYLSIQNGQVQVNIQGVIDWRDAQIASFKDMINAEKAQIDAQSKGLKTRLANYGVEIKAILSVAEANQALADAEQKHAENAAKINGSNASGAMHASMVEDSQYQSVVSGINEIKDAYNSLDQLSSMASTGLNQVGTSMEKTSSSTEKSTYVTDKYKQSMDQLTTSLEKLKNLQQQYPNYSQNYRDALKQEIDLLKQQKDLTDAQAKNLQGQISSGIIQQTGMITSNSGGGSSSSSNYNYASGGSTQAQIWNFLKGKGLSDSAIAGIMGNLQVESGFDTTALGPQTKYGRPQGLAQWLGSRLTNLQSKPNWTSLDTQLNFLWSEWASMMPNNFNNLSASQAATTFESLFERSGGSLNSKRVANANSILSQFAGSGGSYTGGATSSTNTSNSAAQQAQAVDQAKSDLLNLQQTSTDLQSQIQDIYLQIVQSQTAYYDHIKTQYDAQIAQYDYLQNVENKNSFQWLQAQMNREASYQQQIKAEQDSIDYLKQQIAYNSQLTEAQKATLSDDMLQRQQEVLSIEQKLFDTRSQMADEIVNTYKTALQDMKDAATKTIDNMINDINKQADQADYKKKLSDAQKSAQDIQNEINKLMLDDSTAAKKRIADLQKQLSDQNDSISQMVADNNKQQQIDNLNTQKDTISAYYDNMMNDEQKFSQMRNDILNINNKSIIDSLKSLSTQVQANVNVLGTSVVNTLIDAINRANGYMDLSIQNKSVIGHIASLDTGGYTGTFSGGKLAMLHEKEIVLNQSDTSNFLKAINVTKDFFANLVRMPNLNGLVSSPASASGNNYYVNFQVDKMTGNQSDVDNFITKFVNGVKAKGGVIK